MGFQVQFSSPSSRFVESNEMMGLASRQTRNGRLDYFYRYIDDREVLFLALDSVPPDTILVLCKLIRPNSITFSFSSKPLKDNL